MIWALIATFTGTTVSFGAGSAAAALGNLSPADALKAFETEPGFTVELVAAEPLTIDPVGAWLRSPVGVVGIEVAVGENNVEAFHPSTIRKGILPDALPYGACDPQIDQCKNPQWVFAGLGVVNDFFEPNDDFINGIGWHGWIFFGHSPAKERII